MTDLTAQTLGAVSAETELERKHIQLVEVVKRSLRSEKLLMYSGNHSCVSTV